MTPVVLMITGKRVAIPVSSATPPMNAWRWPSSPSFLSTICAASSPLGRMRCLHYDYNAKNKLAPEQRQKAGETVCSRV